MGGPGRGGTNERPSAEAEARVSFSPFPEGKNMGIGGRWLVDTRGGKRREFTIFLKKIKS